MQRRPLPPIEHMSVDEISHALRAGKISLLAAAHELERRRNRSCRYPAHNRTIAPSVKLR
jgi:hypothetical protein